MSEQANDDIVAIPAGPLKPGQVSTETRRAYVARALLDHVQPIAIARKFGVHRSTIHRDIKAIQRDMGSVITDLDVRAYAAEHMARGDLLAARLLGAAQKIPDAPETAPLSERIASQKAKADLWGQAFNVERAVMEDLQGLGFIVKAPTVVKIAPALDVLANMSDDELRTEMRKVLDAEFALAEPTGHEPGQGGGNLSGQSP